MLLRNNVLDGETRFSREEIRITIVTWIEYAYHHRRRQYALGTLFAIQVETKITTPDRQAA